MIFVYSPGKVRYPRNWKSWKKSQRNLDSVNTKVANYRPLKASYLRFKFLRTRAKANTIRIQRNSRGLAKSMKVCSEVMTKNKGEEVAGCAVVELSLIKAVAVAQTPTST